MDIGSGSLWQSALLARLVGENGKVYAIEIVPELYALGRANIAQFPELAERIASYCQDATPGLPEIARTVGGFDVIVAAAEVRAVPEAWRTQLKTGGRFLYPEAGALVYEKKNTDGAFVARSYPGFAFVPFV